MIVDSDGNIVKNYRKEGNNTLLLTNRETFEQYIKEQKTAQEILFLKNQIEELKNMIFLANK